MYIKAKQKQQIHNEPIKFWVLWDLSLGLLDPHLSL